MGSKPKEAPVPSERHETLRKEMIEALTGQTLSARELSGAVRISIKDVLAHLEHIEKSLHKHDAHLVIIPAECNKCGFVFRKRERLTKPGKCPVCRGESIQEPRYSIRERSAEDRRTKVS